ncbi:MAG: toll/interleukin-1 receptor domain-containing protein [Anaerolineaceae bacterium]|nr:MAG: toll/interleukin-1 receptor domain-containing protein [Anaerolineaceae bacterium]
MPDPKRPLKVFLCHAHSDKDAVKALYTHLTNDGVDAWLDKAKLLPGQDWELEIRKAVREADVVVVCLSQQFNQAGFRQKEVRLALDTAMEKPEGEIFIIPARLEECNNLESLRKWHWVDLFEEDGYEMLMLALQKRAETVGLILQIKKNKLPKNISSQPKKIPNALPPLSSEVITDNLAFDGLIVMIIFIVAGIFLVVQIQPVLQILYDLFYWQYFGILAIIWVAADLVWIERWKSLIGRVAKLISKPLIYKLDEEPNAPRLYPRTFLEQLASSTRRTDNDSTAGFMGAFLNAQKDRMFDPQNPLISLGYVISLVFFAFFLIADASVVANMLWLTGVIHRSPDIVYRPELAILGGAVLTTVVGVWTLVELSGIGELMNTDSMTAMQKTLYKMFASVAILISVLVMFFLAVQRLINLSLLESDPTTNMILSFVLYGLLAINNSLSAALTFQPAGSGFIVVLYLLFVIFPVLAFILDILGRPIYIVIDITLWAIFTPIIAIPYWIGQLIKMFTRM